MTMTSAYGRRKDDHEIKIGSTTKSFEIMRDENGRAMYTVIEEAPRYREPLELEQTNWIGGHGQHDFKGNDLYFEGQSIDTTQDGRIILGPEITEQKEDDASSIEAPVVFCWFPAVSKLFCATATHIYRLDADGWDVTSTDLSGVIDLKGYGVTLFAARGDSTAYSYSTDGDAFTASNLGDNKANGFLVAPNAAGTAEVFWKWKAPNELTNNSNGANGGGEWSSPAYIGDTGTTAQDYITNAFISNNQLVIGRTDGLWWYDSDGGTHQLRPDLRKNRSSDNFKYVAEWQTGIYHSEINGMSEITAYGQYEPMGPLTGIDDIGRRGSVVGITSDKDWLYVAIKDGQASPEYHIYKGREVRKEGVLRWEWCPWIYLGTNATATLAVVQHSATSKKLWFGYGAATYTAIITDNPTEDSAARFTTVGWVRMSYNYGTDANWDQLWQSATLEVTGGASGETVQVKYRKDTDTSATSCIAAAATNGIFETNFASALNCNRIQFELHLASNTNTATPEVSYFKARGIEKPTYKRIHDVTYRIGATPSKQVDTIRTFLRGGRTSTSLIKFADLRFSEATDAGTSYVWVIMLPGYPKEPELIHEKGRQPELGIHCRFMEVSFTIS